MPELPDVTVYVERLGDLLVGTPLRQARVKSPFLLRSAIPPLSDCHGKCILAVRRLGKRIAFELEQDLFLVLHLMIAGRLHWKEPGAALSGRRALCALDFDHGCVLLTEASTKHRASLYVEQGRPALAKHDRGGLEVLECSLEQFEQTLRAENRTLKRALTNPRSFSGIGNAYSDEILHQAGLSPVALTSKLDGEQVKKLFEATREVLELWVRRLRAEVSEGLPEKVTAFREEMAVHGRYGQPCPRCATLVQRIRYASNEVNYCPRCQTGGRVLADRSLSRLLRSDWPRSIDEWEGEAALGGAQARAAAPAVESGAPEVPRRPARALRPRRPNLEPASGEAKNPVAGRRRARKAPGA